MSERARALHEAVAAFMRDEVLPAEPTSFCEVADGPDEVHRDQLARMVLGGR